MEKDYDLTIKELLEKVQGQLNKLDGKNSIKEGGFSKLVESSLSEIETFLFKHYITVKDCRLKIFCSAFDKDIVFAEVLPVYKPDKRKPTGFGDYLKTVKIKLKEDIPLELCVIDLSQYLSYNEAKKNFDRLLLEQNELLKQYKINLKAMEKMEDIMKYEAYDNNTKVEAEEAREIIYNSYSRKIYGLGECEDDK